MDLPTRAVITEWNETDQLGWLTTSGGERLKLGASACTDFRPALGMECWLVEVKPDPITKGVRAKIVNVTGAQEKDKATQLLEAAEAEKKRKAEEAERKQARRKMPVETFLREIEKATGFRVPDLFLRASQDKKVVKLFPEVEWYGPAAIFDELEPSIKSPAVLKDTSKGVSIEDVQRAWKHEIPFAWDGGNGWWCWKRDWTDGDRIAVVRCEKTGEIEGYAPDFAGFLFRQALELEQFGEEKALLKRAATALKPYLGEPWSLQLETLAKEKARAASEAIAELIRKELSFAHLDEKADVFTRSE